MRPGRTTGAVSLAAWYLRRLRTLAAAPCRYGRWDTVNAYLASRGLIAETGRDAGADRREYAITETGRDALAQAADAPAALRSRPRVSVCVRVWMAPDEAASRPS